MRRQVTGNFTHSITITNPDTGDSITVEALVDTGATFTMLPASQLEALGLRPSRAVRGTLADGRTMELPTGRALISVLDRTEFSPCVFGPEAARPLLGAVTVEVLLLGVDPVRQVLIPVDALFL